jgi:hypothetical protein
MSPFEEFAFHIEVILVSLKYECFAVVHNWEYIHQSVDTFLLQDVQILKLLAWAQECPWCFSCPKARTSFHSWCELF